MTARARGRRLAFLVTREAYADLRAVPRHGAALLSQTVLGERVRLLDEREGWRRVETANGYSGWVREWALAAAPRRAEPRARVVVPYLPILAGPSRSAARVGEAGFMARLDVEGTRGAFLRVRLPDGESAWAPRAGVETRPRAGRPALPAHMLAVGRGLLGTPYLWGGASSRGFDCSGLVMRLFEWAGVLLPRDAWQQAALGLDIDDPSDAGPGDLLFFGPPRGRIDHVAIAMGAGRILHASRSRVRVDAIAPRARGEGAAARGRGTALPVPELRRDLAARFRGGRRYPCGL